MKIYFFTIKTYFFLLIQNNFAFISNISVDMLLLCTHKDPQQHFCNFLILNHFCPSHLNCLPGLDEFPSKILPAQHHSTKEFTFFLCKRKVAWTVKRSVSLKVQSNLDHPIHLPFNVGPNGDPSIEKSLRGCFTKELKDNLARQGVHIKRLDEIHI